MKKLIFLSSACRFIGSISDFQTTLPSDLFEWDDQYEEGVLTLINFTSKMSYYNLSFFRNSQFIYNDGSADTTITLPEGNYNVTEIANLLTTALNDAATGITWTVTINMNTLKYSYTYVGSPTGPVVVTEILNSFDILGFNGTSRTITASDTSDKIVSIGNIQALYIHLNYVGGQNKSVEHHQHNHENNLDNIFAKVNISGVQFFGNIIYEQGDYRYSTIIPNSASTTIEISIRDKEGNIVDLSEDYNMVLEIEIRNKKPFKLEDLGKLMILQTTQLIK